MLHRQYVPQEARFQGYGTPLRIPAPTAGLNTRDAYQDMAPNEARVLDNLDPEGTGCKIRPGRAAQSTGAGSGAVETVHVWGGATPVIMASGADGKIYNVTSSSAAELDSGYSENVWQTEYYNGWSFWVNGTDTPFRFDGTSTAATGLSGSGLTISNLVNVGLVRNRLWFCENDSADVWYLGAGGVTGTLTKFQLSQLTSGGYAMAIGSWSRDAGDGPDDYTVFVMSSGEVLVYSGDPGTTFSIVGKYFAPAPVGRKCLVKYGGALAVVSKQGLIPLDAIISGSAFDPYHNELALVGKLAPSFTADFEDYGSNSGWDSAFVAGKIYINIPATGGTSHQYVFNTRNGTWTRYTDLPVASLACCPYQNTLFFGGLEDGKVWKLSESDDDDGNSIIGRVRSAFVEPFNGRAGSYTAVRHRVNSESNRSGRFIFDVDYLDSKFPPETIEFVKNLSTTPWGSAWGSPWGGSAQIPPLWYSSSGHGRSVGVALEIYSDSASTYYNGTDVMAIPAGWL